MISDRMLALYPYGAHDEHLFSNIAFHLSNGNWLGPYDQFTLIKGFIYSFFMMWSHVAGIPLFLAELLFLTFSIVLLLKAIHPIVNNKGILLVIYTTLLFNPFGYTFHPFLAIRDSFFSSLSLAFFAAGTGFFIRLWKGYPVSKLLAWSVVWGLLLFAAENTREESLLLLPALIGFSVLSTYKIIRVKKENAAQSYFSKKLLLILLPYLMLWLGNLGVKSMNYIYYDAFIRNEMKEPPFLKVYQQLLSIDSDTLVPMHPLTFEMMDKAFAVSPTLQEIQSLYAINAEHGIFKQYNHKELVGGISMWMIRLSASLLGYHESYTKARQFYQHISDELATAFEEGRLKQTSYQVAFIYPLHPQMIIPIIKEAIIDISISFKFNLIEVFHKVYPADPERLQLFQTMTNESMPLLEEAGNHRTLAYLLKKKLRNSITKLYAYLFPFIFFLSIPAFLFNIWIILRKKWESNVLLLVFWVSVISLYLYLSRIFIFALNNLVLVPSRPTRYLDTAIPFMLLFSLLSILIASRFINIFLGKNKDVI